MKKTNFPKGKISHQIAETTVGKNGSSKKKTIKIQSHRFQNQGKLAEQPSRFSKHMEKATFTKRSRSQQVSEPTTAEKATEIQPNRSHNPWKKTDRSSTRSGKHPHKRPSLRQNVSKAVPEPTDVEKKSFFEGTIIVHPRGFGFVNRKAPLQDIFIPKQLINGAVDGDTVNVEIFENSKSTKGPEGKVASIKTRARNRVVGTVSTHSDKKCEVYAPLLGAQSFVVCNLKKKSACKIGDRVSVAILQWGHREKPAEGELLSVIGSVNTPLDDVPYILAETEIRQKFPEDAIEQAKQYGKRVTPKDIEGRLDLREFECVTIDPDTAKDFDDAVSVEERSNSFRVGVHIADVSYYVQA
jgi:ribonuclease R